MAADIHEQLTKYITDAHSIEVQALAQLEKAPDVAEYPPFEQALREHTSETERHERLTRQLLDERDASPSRLKDMIMGLGGKGFLAFARAQPDTPGKLLAHALSYEALETAAYELLARTADRAGEANVSGIAREVGADERAMMTRLEGCYDGVVEVSLRGVAPDQLKRVARRANDEETATMADRILVQERTAARRIEGMFDEAVAAALDAVGVMPR